MSSPRLRMKVLALYKTLLRESQKFTSYNFRTYSLRRVRDAFRENRDVQDTTKIEELIEFGEQNVDVIKRQVMLGHLYKDIPIILEQSPGTTPSAS